jgi:glycogen synthase
VTFVRRLFGLATLAALAVGAVVVMRRRAGLRERVDLYYEDGSMATLERGDADAQALLGHAREALAAARPA